MFCIILSAARDDRPSARYITHTVSSGFQFHPCAVQTKKETRRTLLGAKSRPSRSCAAPPDGAWTARDNPPAGADISTKWEVTTDVKDKMSPAAVLTCLINKLSHSTLLYILSQPILTQWPAILYTVYIIDVNELKGSEGFGEGGGGSEGRRFMWSTCKIWHVFICDVMESGTR